MTIRIGLLTMTATLAACGGGSVHGDDQDPPDAAALAVDASPPPAVITPNPIVSRRRPVTSSEGASTSAGPIASAVDGVYQNDGFEATASSGHAPWLAVDVGAGPTRLMLSWLSEGDVERAKGSPRDYHIDVSADGASWRTVVTIKGNGANAREHAFDFTGQTRVRLVVDAAEGGRFRLVEVEAHDVSQGAEDTWLFLGDSITAMAMNRYIAPDFAARVHDARPGFTPMVIDDAIGGTQTTSATSPDPDDADRVPIDTWIARYPDIRNVVVAYGTNDAGCDTSGEGIDGYIERLGAIVDKLTAAGKRVVIPHIPWNTWPGCKPTALPPYNAAIDRLRAAHGVIAGPDLYTYFAAHHDQLFDGVHPDDDGIAAMNRMWAEAVLPLYR